MRVNDERDFFWLVGLLEGEGSFLRPSPSKPYEPKIDIEMKDRDCIERVAALFGLQYRTRDRHRAENHAITYNVRLVGKRAVQLMWMLKPYMSKRRQQQIERAIETYASRGIKYHPLALGPLRFKTLCRQPLCAQPITLGDYCEEHGEQHLTQLRTLKAA